MQDGQRPLQELRFYSRFLNKSDFVIPIWLVIVITQYYDKNFNIVEFMKELTKASFYPAKCHQIKIDDQTGSQTDCPVGLAA